MVLKAGLKLPTWVLLDPQYDGLSAEQVYRIRQQKRHQQEQEKQQHQSEPSADSKQMDASNQNGDDEADDDGDQAESKESDNCRDDGGDEPGDADLDEAFGNGERVTPVDDDSDAGGNLGEESSNGEANHSNAEGRHEHRDQGDDGINEPSDSNDPKGCGEILDAVPDTNAGSLAEQEAEWDVRIRQAVNVAAKTAGSVPGFLAPIVEQNKEAKHDWRQELRRFNDPSQGKDYSWSRTVGFSRSD